MTTAREVQTVAEPMRSNMTLVDVVVVVVVVFVVVVVVVGACCCCC